MVTCVQEDGLAIVTLDQPELMNALSFEVLGEIGAAIDKADQWNIRALIFAGSGPKAFCAGANIKELMGRSLLEQRSGADRGQATFAKLDRFKVPSIAAIHGYALGGGLELALACSFRVSTPGAKMGLPEIKLGLIPGYGGTQRLPRLIGEALALEMILTGRIIDAADALRIGLINRIAEGDVLQAAKQFASEFTCYSLPALTLAREAVMRALATPLCQGLRIEADLSTLAYQTEDATEGLGAFIEKRSPSFRDR
jgi:enoyl-CoA hydratase